MYWGMLVIMYHLVAVVAVTRYLLIALLLLLTHIMFEASDVSNRFQEQTKKRRRDLAGWVEQTLDASSIVADIKLGV